MAVSEETRLAWNKSVEFIIENAEEVDLDDYETDFIDHMQILLANEYDLNFKQSSFLRKLKHKVEEAIG